MVIIISRCEFDCSSTGPAEPGINLPFGWYVKGSDGSFDWSGCMRHPEGSNPSLPTIDPAPSLFSNSFLDGQGLAFLLSGFCFPFFPDRIPPSEPGSSYLCQVLFFLLFLSK